MTQTATGTSARADCASTRSAIFLAKASKSMAVSFLMSVAWKIQVGDPSIASASVAESPQIESQAIFCVSGLVKALLKQSLDLALRSRPGDRGHAGVPAGSDLDVRRQAGGTDEALRVRYRPLVKRRDARCQRVDEAVKFAVRQRPVHIAIGFSEVSPDIIGAQEHLQRSLSAHLPWQARHWPSACDQADSHFPLRQKRFLTARKTHVAGQGDLTPVPSRAPADQSDGHDGRPRKPDEYVRPRLQSRRPLRHAGQILHICVEVTVIQEVPIAGTLEHQNPDLLVSLDGPDDLS